MASRYSSSLGCVMRRAGLVNGVFIENMKESTRLYVVPINSTSIAQMLTKAGSQVAVLMCGTATTDNDLHDETAASGDEQQYRHITVKHPFEHPSMDMLRSVADGECGKAGVGDHQGTSAGECARCSGVPASVCSTARRSEHLAPLCVPAQRPRKQYPAHRGRVTSSTRLLWPWTRSTSSLRPTRR